MFKNDKFNTDDLRNIKVNKIIDNKKFYDILGIHPTASESELKKAYHKKILKENFD
jgi:preprotein translocase subunit Sec63